MFNDRLESTVIVILGALTTGTIAEQLIQLTLNSHGPQNGQHYDIGDASIYALKKGTGGPTVVFQSGLGSGHMVWRDIQDSISRYTTTISYDRPGLLWTDDDGQDISAAHISIQLSSLLEKAGCPKPYILVGHSMAGITLRSFVRDHHDEVQAVQFVDVAHPLQMKRDS